MESHDEVAEREDQNGHVTDEEIRKNLLDDLAEIREEHKLNTVLYLAIPGYKSYLVGVYRPFPLAKNEKRVPELQRAMRKRQPVVLRNAINTICDACEEVRLCSSREFDAQTGEGTMPIDNEAVPPIAYDERLADLLIKHPEERRLVTNAAGVVQALFPTEHSILSHAVEIQNFLNGAEVDDDEALGESLGNLA